MSKCKNTHNDPERTIAIESIAVNAFELRDAIFEFGDDGMIIAADLVIRSIGKVAARKSSTKRSPETTAISS